MALATAPVHAQQAAPDSSAHASAIAPAARDTTPLPARPNRGLGADTNSAQGYFEYGMQIVYRKPEEAARAFYWAHRIDPTSGDALYALHAATILAMPVDELIAYLHVDKETRSPKYAALDSMDYFAYQMNPFVFGSLDPSVLYRIIEAKTLEAHKHATSRDVNMNIFSVTAGDANYAWIQYARNQLPEALATYAKVLSDTSSFPRWAKARDSVAIRKHRQALASQLHAQRGRIFYMLDSMDSARVEMTAALDGMRAHDDKDQTFLYHSKAMYEQSLGMIYQRTNQIDLAREAYGHALEEDLSYYAAHMHLAQLDLARRDTAAALVEMDLAVQLNPNDPVVRLRYAETLVHASATAMLPRSYERLSHSIRTTAHHTCCWRSSRTSSSTRTTRSASTQPTSRWHRRKTSNCSSRKHA